MGIYRTCIYIFLLFLFAKTNYALPPDSIYVLKNCYFPWDSNVDRYFVTPALHFGNPESADNLMIDSLPVPNVPYEVIAGSVMFSPLKLSLFIRPEIKQTIQLKINSSGNITSINCYPGGDGLFEQSVYNSFSKIGFKPAIYEGEAIESAIIIPLILNFIFTKYQPDSSLIEQEYPSALLFTDIIPQNKNFIAEREMSAEENGRKEAERDIARGKIQLLTGGFKLGPFNTAEEVILTKSYGFKYYYTGCVIPSGFTGYNERMIEYLNTLNGAGWYPVFLEKFRLLRLEEDKKRYKD